MGVSGNWQGSKRGLSRREFVGLSGMSAAALAFGAGPLTGKVEAQPRFSGNPYSLGVASGDPLPDSVVLWTRLAPRPLEPFGGVDSRKKIPVRWEVAADEGFRKVLQRGSDFAYPEYVHAVHVNVQGLQPGREYYYRFKAGPEISPVGRTKTAPALGAGVGEYAFAFASCQNYPSGFYNAYQHMAQEDLDAVIFLGDYIYEGGGQGSLGREHEPKRELYSLGEYRVRTAQYKTDPNLQRVHALFPWMTTWDDHEVDNNWADEYSQDYPEESREEFLVRRANAFRSYWEHMPLRPMRMPKGPDLPLYRRFTFGDLVQFNILDTRQYRSDQVAGPGRQPPSAESRDPSRTITGAEQERWLLDGLGRSRATWNVLAQEVFFSQRDFDPGPGVLYNMDAWDGYVASRDRILDGITARGVRNPVVITGDVHQNYAAEIKENFDDPDSATIGTEFVGTSITSFGNGSDTSPAGLAQLEENPHLKYYNRQRGYVLCTLTPGQWRTDYKVLEYVTRRGSPIRTDATFVVEDGQPGLQEV